MSLRLVVVCVAAVAAVGLAGCSDAESDTAAPAAATTAAKAEPAKAEPTKVGAGSGKDVCAHLTKELPRIKAVGSEVGAMAQLTMSLAGFYETHPKPADGEELDAQTEKDCPEVRAEMLKAAGMKSFADF